MPGNSVSLAGTLQVAMVDSRGSVTLRTLTITTRTASPTEYSSNFPQDWPNSPEIKPMYIGHIPSGTGHLAVGLIDNIYNAFDGTDELINGTGIDHRR
ncbi:uncharacterized protein Z518_09691 [Rhinocladiella mackenziei CBS 650.93]|uniref:Uncharacterized protein n=1 Tax=Rhinocladiella mackenziei CBS 650.93 TaxID=1442369 RepID=A0A0D2IBG2_9EURO|nr:uncharacterized protein Z518_09691 [Rhinocladiella mackenziei CBS 650.93]KIX00626.1 hypothetical protein Z518_09691 [Rhinocladiella mackenziei CBS 650.93]